MLSINLDDVATVLNSCRPQIIFLVICLVAFVVALVLAGVKKKWSKGRKFMVRAQAGIGLILAIVITANALVIGPLNNIVANATGSGKISQESIDEAYQIVDNVAAEGMTLLENDGTLPLAEGTKLNVFGWASVAPVYGGVGSGAISDKYEIISLIKGLTNAGFEVNQDLVDFYTSYKDARPDVGMWAQDWTLPEPNVSAYSDDLLNSAKSYSDTALIVISRPGGENADLPTDMNAVVDGSWKHKDDNTGNTYFNGTYDDTLNEGNDWDEGDHYLQLDNREEELIDLVTSNFDKVIVIINANNAMELGFLKDNDKINAAIYAPCPGQSGFNAVGQVLDGEVNPSGHTVDTFIRDLTTAPSYNNFGLFEYDNAEEFGYTSTSWLTQQETTTIPEFLNYTEGIYNGYKFYETAYAEAQAGNMDYDYDAQVVYPFGYGLSYTDFTQTIDQVNVSGNDVSVDVTVTNTGSVAGKAVIELYFTPPYTNGGIEKAAVNLVQFDKTDLLDPGASQTMTITFKLEDMASYDEYNEKAYVLEAGDYVISVRSDAHNVLDEKTITVDSTIVYDESNPRSTDKQAATNQFESAYGEGITYLSRKDGFANYDEATAAPTNYSMSDAQKSTFLENSNYNPEDYNNADDVMPTMGAKNGLTVADMRGLDYDDAKWDDLLDEMTMEDMDNLIAHGGYATAAVDSIGKVATSDCDGPSSINNNFTQQSSIGFPGCVLIASTWNTDCSYAFGASIGKMADEMDVSGWYAPAMNNHRSAFSGRNFEYFSEDGVLAGYMAAGAVSGAWNEHGVYAYIKHFAFNDQESGRNSMICVYSNEQALREIYLKPFEICVKTGGAKAVMSSFNYIGTEWAGGYYPLQTTVLRNEWGFQGFVLTDYYGVYAYMDADQAIRGGTDMMLSPTENATNHLHDMTSATSAIAARKSCHNILYTIANSRAYAEENLNPGLENWQKIVIAVDIITAAVVVLLEVLTIRGYRRRNTKIFVEKVSR